MLLRKKEISLKSETAEVSVSFGTPDVKTWMRLFAQTLTRGREENVLWAQSQSLTETDVRCFFENSGNILLSYPAKWRTQLSAWAWATAVRNGFLEPSATPGHENVYHLADSCFLKRGRPKNK